MQDTDLGLQEGPPGCRCGELNSVGRAGRRPLLDRGRSSNKVRIVENWHVSFRADDWWDTGGAGRNGC